MLSVVITALNEQRSIAQLCDELFAMASRHDHVLDVIIVDDGSTDGTWDVVQEIAGKRPDVRGVRLRRNFGKAAALSAGFEVARGDLVVTMDADLQDDPADIPNLLDKIHEGADVVCGWKRERRDAYSRVIASRVFNWLVRRITGVPLHDHNCGLKCCRREILSDVHLYGELHRFIPVMAASLGYKVDEVEVHHRPRKYGRSNYGLERIPKGLLDLVTVQFLTSFRQRPQHLLGMIGLASFAIGALGIVVLTCWWFLSRSSLFPGWKEIHLHQRPIFYLTLTAMILGAQFLAAGFLAELTVAMLQKDSRRTKISISARVGFEGDDENLDADNEPSQSPSAGNGAESPCHDEPTTETAPRYDA